MSSKVTLAWRSPEAGKPGYRLYEDLLDHLGADDGANAPVYLELAGVGAEVSTMQQPGTCVVTVLLPRELAIELGLLRPAA